MTPSVLLDLQQRPAHRVLSVELAGDKLGSAGHHHGWIVLWGQEFYQKGRREASVKEKQLN